MAFLIIFLLMNILKMILVFCMVHIPSIEAQQLSDYKWKNRVVILSDKDADLKNAKMAVKVISAYEKELENRDIILFLHNNGTLYTTNSKVANIKDTPIIPKDFTGYLLIGKDGGIKSKAPYPIEPKEIFTLIDGMPMRRAEMKSNN